MQSKALLIAAMLLATVIFIPFYWATGSGREAAATAAPQSQPTVPAFLSPEQGQIIFEQKCIACHSIGKGKLVGPDLKGITSLRDREWLIRFIVSPEKLIAEGDPLARQLVEDFGGIEMPNMGLSDSEAEAVLAYIETQSGGELPKPSPTQNTETPTPAPSEKPVSTEQSAPAPRGDAGTGRDIFTGKVALQNGGASCISCHDISGIGAPGGGSMGRELNNAYTSFGGVGLSSLLKNPPFPMMKEIYTGQPMTEEEIASLVAFLEETGKGEQAPPRNRNTLLILSAAVFLVILGVFQFLWRRRLSGVRQRLVRGGSQ